MLNLANKDGIDGSDLKRLLPQHTVRNLVDKVWDLCRLGILIEDPMDFGMIRYRLDPNYPQHSTLKKLLAAIVRMHPVFAKAYAMRARLWPEYRATRELNRVRHVRNKG